jgi:antitoxin component YwqK of YwqJK toxin-antitoxin module
MKTLVGILFLGLFTTLAGFAQEGELVSIDAETKRSYYTRNDNYTVESDGSFTGNIIAYHENGKAEETGALFKGEKTGRWIKYNSEGVVIASAGYVDGKKDGMWKIWDGNGKIRMEMHYDKGQRVGVWKIYNESGKILNQKFYE